MSRRIIIFGIMLILSWKSKAQPDDPLLFSGQASTWINYNFDQDVPLWIGARYIPQLNYKVKKDKKQLDFEVSGNINGTLGIKPVHCATHDGNIKLYRTWARYSSERMEVRLGLQKINFGSAAMMRPLMWFDRLDPRDPLQLTDGVWGALGRYYFRNNANLWLWTLYPSNTPKTWELSKSNRHYPELGGRIQHPVPKGEMGLSYHWRMADTRGNLLELPVYDKLPEHRLGIDGKWDLGVGVWFEGTWTSHSRPLGSQTHQSILSAGTDYTFGIGNGLNVILEQLLISSGEKTFQFSNSKPLSGFSVSYPIDIFDQINAIVFFDWKGKNAYTFINLRRRYKRIDLYLMAYWNPKTSPLPNQNDAGTLFAGKGIQSMLVFNH